VTIEMLSRHRKKQLQEELLLGSEYQDFDLVIAREDGRPVYYRTVDNQWLKCIKDARVPHMGIHGLRHTHASTLIAQGVPVNVVSERLGHARTSITMDIYVHSNDEQQRQAANSFAATIDYI
jgi:integrase